MTYEWNALHHERARALFAKYGLTAELDQWMSHPNLQVKRVEKPIRMRVRRICHRCLIPFGSSSSCSNCEHVRCKKCPRYPPLVVDTKGKGKAVATIDVPLARAGTTQLKEKHKAPLLTIPSRRGGQDLIYRPPRQRIRRTCHRCGSLFKGGATECVTCKHIRCKLCPRDPYVPFWFTIVFVFPPPPTTLLTQLNSHTSSLSFSLIKFGGVQLQISRAYD
jgi:hypothetical protein